MISLYTKDEKDLADARLEASRKEVKSKQCPVWEKKCMGKPCASYFDGRVDMPKEDSASGLILLHEAECKCALVTGKVEVIQPN